MTHGPIMLAAITLGIVAALPGSSVAQTTRPHPTIGLAAQSYTINADEVDGTLMAAGVATIIPINSLLDVEAEWLRPAGTVRREYTGVLFSFAEPGATREEIERMGVVVRTTHERRVSSVLSVGAAFHPRRTGSRFEPRASVGVTTHFVRNRSLYEPLTWPPSVTRERVFQAISPVESHNRAIGSLTVGAGVAIDLTEHLVVLPDLRYDYGSIGDELNNSWRAGAKVLWRF